VTVLKDAIVAVKTVTWH